MSNIVSNLSSSHLYSPSYYCTMPSMSSNLYGGVGLGEELTWAEFGRTEINYARSELESLSAYDWWSPSERLMYYGSWDGIYHQDKDKRHRLYNLVGVGEFFGYELNWYRMGMLTKHRGFSLLGAKAMVWTWKSVNIPISLYQFYTGKIERYEVYGPPTRNEMYMLKRGFNEYTRPPNPYIMNDRREQYWSPSANMFLPVP